MCCLHKTHFEPFIAHDAFPFITSTSLSRFTTQSVCQTVTTTIGATSSILGLVGSPTKVNITKTSDIGTSVVPSEYVSLLGQSTFARLQTESFVESGLPSTFVTEVEFQSFGVFCKGEFEKIHCKINELTDSNVSKHFVERQFQNLDEKVEEKGIILKKPWIWYIES